MDVVDVATTVVDVATIVAVMIVVVVHAVATAAVVVATTKTATATTTTRLLTPRPTLKLTTKLTTKLLKQAKLKLTKPPTLLKPKQTPRTIKQQLRATRRRIGVATAPLPKKQHARVKHLKPSVQRNLSATKNALRGASAQNKLRNQRL